MRCSERSIVTLLAPCLLLILGCGSRVPTPVGGPAGSPRVGWVIMSGDAENPDRDYVCQSIAEVECVIPPSTPNARVFGHAHFYYHPAAVETRYAGSIRVGFFGGSSGPYEVKPNFTVQPGGSPYNQSVMDSITTKPGTYEMTVDVVATAVASGEKQNVRDKVTVVVR